MLPPRLPDLSSERIAAHWSELSKTPAFTQFFLPYVIGDEANGERGKYIEKLISVESVPSRIAENVLKNLRIMAENAINPPKKQNTTTLE